MWTRARAVIAAYPVSLLTMALAGALLKPGPGRMPLSWDEAVPAAAAQRSLPQLWHPLRHTDAPLGVYYLAQHVWMSTLRTARVVPTEPRFRLPSAPAGIVAVGLATYLTGLLPGRQVALLAGVMLAIWPQFELYGQDARPYSAAVAAVLDARHGDVVLFDPASYRVGFAYYAGRDPISDANSAPLRGLCRGPAIGGRVTAPVSTARRIRLVTDNRRGAVRLGYHRAWSRTFGVVSLDLLLR